MDSFTDKHSNKFRVLFLLSSITSFITIILVSTATVYYPGGNFMFPTMEGYSFVYNSICDMSSRTAVNGQSNIVSSNLVRTAIIFFYVGMLIYFSIIWMLFQKEKKTKYLSIIGSFFGTVQIPLNLLIIFYHGSFKFHMTTLVIAPIALEFALILYTIVFFMEKEWSQISKYSLLVLSALAIIYSLIVAIASAIGGEFEFIVHRMGNMIFSILIAVTFILQGFRAYLSVKKGKNNPFK